MLIISPAAGNTGTVQQTNFSNQTPTEPVFISGGGTLALGSTNATVEALMFTNGGQVTMGSTSTLTLSGGDVATQSTSGLPSTANIVGGTLALNTGTTQPRAFNIASSSSSGLSGPTQALVFGGTGATGTAGNFTLTFNGQTTSNIAFSTTATALASNIQAALAALTNIGTGNVSVAATSPAPPAGTGVTVTFLNQPLGISLQALVVNGIAGSPVANTNAVQNLTFPGNATGGQFVLSYSGQTSAPIAYNSTAPSTLANNIQTALNKLSTLGATNAVETLNFGGTPSGGTFTLAFGNQTTLPITYSTTATTLQANILNALSALTSISAVGGIGTNSVNVAVGGTATAATVTFQNALGGEPQTAISAVGSLLPLAATISVAPTTTVGAASSSNLTAVSAVSATSVNITFQNGDGGGVTLSTLGAIGTATNAQQQIVFPALTSTSGAFELVFAGSTTGPISYSTTAATLQSNITNALTAIASIGSGNVSTSVSGSPQVATVTFTGTLAGAPQSTLTVLSAVNSLTLPANTTGGAFTLTFGGATTAPIAYSSVLTSLQSSIVTGLGTLSTVAGTTAVNDVQTVNFSSNAVTGTFTLVYTSGASSQTTAPITYSSTAATLQQNIAIALNGLTLINSVAGVGTSSVNVAVGGTNTAATITFQNALGGAPQSLLTTGPSTLTGGSITGIGHTTTGAAASSPVATVTAASATSVSVTFNTLQAASNSALLGVSGLSSNASQEISFAGITGGTFKLTYAGSTTQPITFSTTASVLQTNLTSALSSLANIGAGAVAITVSGSPLTATVTFVGALAGTSQNANTIAVIGTTSNVNTVQQVTFPGSPAGGTFTLTFPNAAGTNVTTAPITYNPATGTLQTNIQAALDTAFGTGNTLASVVNANTVNITFQGTLAAGVVQAQGSGNGTSSPALNAVQLITFGGAPAGGTFTLSLTDPNVNGGVPKTTNPITYSTNLTTFQSNVQTALNAAFGAGTTAVAALGPTTVQVTFQGTLGSKPINTMTGSGITSSAVQALNFTGSPTGGTFQLQFSQDGITTLTTAPISFSTNPGTLQANIQSSLDALANLGFGNSAVIVNAAATNATVAFQNGLANTGVQQFQTLNVALTGGTAPGLTTSTLVSGQGLLGTGTLTVTSATTQSGRVAGLAGLTSSNQNVLVALTTVGLGLTGSAANPATTNPTTAGGQGGLSGGASQIATAAGFNLGANFAGTTPTTIVAGGQGGSQAGGVQPGHNAHDDHHRTA